MSYTILREDNLLKITINLNKLYDVNNNYRECPVCSRDSYRNSWSERKLNTELLSDRIESFLFPTKTNIMVLCKGCRTSVHSYYRETQKKYIRIIEDKGEINEFDACELAEEMINNKDILNIEEESILWLSKRLLSLSRFNVNV